MKKIIFHVKGVLLGTLLVVCLCSCGKDTTYYVEHITESEPTESIDSEKTEDLQLKGEDIYVYVCGQIHCPGVYVLSEGSRVCDLFVIAGGFTEHAAVDYWNQARLLRDGEMIYVPSKEEVKDRTFDGKNNGFTSEDSGKVNINTASKEQLMTIPGIGESKASAIIAYREKNGSFSSIEEVKNVEGIKDGVYSKMKDYIEI